MKSPKALLLCLLCVFLWGVGYPVVKMAYEYWAIERADVFGKLLFTGVRFTLSGLVLMPVVLARGAKRPSRRMLVRIAQLGVCQTVFQYGLLAVGLAYTTGTKGSVLNQFGVFVLVLVTPLFFKEEKLTVRKVIGCVIGFAGIIVMNLRGLSLSVELGDVLVLASSLFAAAGYLISKGMKCDPVLSTAYQQMFGGIVLIIVGLAGGGRLAVRNWESVACMGFLVLEVALAFSVWFYLMQQNDLRTMSMYKFLTPVVGVLFSGLLLGERVLTLENGLALACVCAGVVVVNSRRRFSKTAAQ